VRQLPNLLTLARPALTPFCGYYLINGRLTLSLTLIILTGLTDAVDGYLARRLRVETRFGAWMDPVADKILLTSLYISFGVINAVPLWLVWLVVGRDVLILVLVAAGLAFTRVREFPPSIWGKISTVIQIVGVVLLLAARAGSVIAKQLHELTIWAVAAGTFWSGLHYIWRAFALLRASRYGT
jgi:cardiolipin synthase